MSHKVVFTYSPVTAQLPFDHVAIEVLPVTPLVWFKLASGDLTQWKRLLPAVQYGLNARISARYKSTPFSLIFGRKLNALTDYTGTTSDLLSEEELVNRALTLAQVVYPITSSAEDYNAKMFKSFSDSKKIISDFKPGDRVMMKNLNKTQKGDELFVRSYTVVEHKGSGTYTLKDATGEPLNAAVTSKHLKLIKKTDDTPSYEVESILLHKGVGDQRQYLVRWKGFSSEHDSWEPVSNFDTQDVIKKYHQAARLSQSSVKGSRRHANKVPVKSRSNQRAKK